MSRVYQVRLGLSDHTELWQANTAEAALRSYLKARGHTDVTIRPYGQKETHFVVDRFERGDCVSGGLVYSVTLREDKL